LLDRLIFFLARRVTSFSPALPATGPAASPPRPALPLRGRRPTAPTTRTRWPQPQILPPSSQLPAPARPAHPAPALGSPRCCGPSPGGQSTCRPARRLPCLPANPDTQAAVLGHAPPWPPARPGDAAHTAFPPSACRTAPQRVPPLHCRPAPRLACGCQSLRLCGRRMLPPGGHTGSRVRPHQPHGSRPPWPPSRVVVRPSRLPSAAPRLPAPWPAAGRPPPRRAPPWPATR